MKTKITHLIAKLFFAITAKTATINKMLVAFCLLVLITGGAFAKTPVLGATNLETTSGLSCQTSTIDWQGFPIANQTGTFTTTFDVTPAAEAANIIIGLSDGAATAYSSMGPIIAFQDVNTIEARNGGGYAAERSIPYVPGTLYHFRLVINVASHTYSAYVTPQGGSELTIGTNYAFRTDQATVGSLNYWNLIASGGLGDAVCNFNIPASCQTSSIDWQGFPIANQTGTFTTTFDVTPAASAANIIIGLSDGAATAYSSMGPIIAFQDVNTIEARNGGGYAAETPIPYTPGTLYHFRLVINVATHTYSAYVTPKGGSELTIGTNYAFRTDQATVGSLNYWNLIASGGLGDAVCNFDIPASCQTSSVDWQGFPIAKQTGTFTTNFDVTPAAVAANIIIGLSDGAATAYSSMGPIIAFQDVNTIEARNGGGYAAETPIPYTPGTLYHFRLVINVATHTYSAYVTPKGGSELTIGTNYAFRTDQASVGSLNYWNLIASGGLGDAVCNFNIQIVTQVPEIGISDFVKLYPSPANSMITLELSAVKKNEKVQIYSILGQLVKELNVSAQRLEIDIENLDAGIYIVRLTQSPNLSLKFSKQ